MKTFASCTLARPQERLRECTGSDLGTEGQGLRLIDRTFRRTNGPMLRRDAMLDSSGMPLQTPSCRQRGAPMTEQSAAPHKKTVHVRQAGSSGDRHTSEARTGGKERGSTSNPQSTTNT